MDWQDFSVISPYGEDLVMSSIFPESLSDSAANMPWVLLLPGFTSRRLNKTAKTLAPVLLNAGIAVVVADLGGHGDSGGDIKDQTVIRAANQIGSIIEACKATAWGQSGRCGILGSSFSGAAAIVYAASASRIDCLALKSPVPDYERLRREMIGPSAMGAWEETGVVTLPSGIESRWEFIRDARSVDLFGLLGDVAVPTLMVQGTKDEEIPEDDWRHFVEILRRKDDEVVLVKNGDHGYTTDGAFDPMVRAISSFFIGHLSLM